MTITGRGREGGYWEYVSRYWIVGGGTEIGKAEEWVPMTLPMTMFFFSFVF